MAKKKKDPEPPAADVSTADDSPGEPSSEVRKRGKKDKDKDKDKKGKEPKAEYIEIVDEPEDVEVKGGKTVPSKF